MIKRTVTATSLGLLLCAYATAQPLTPAQYGDFENYVLALSWQSGFCQSMHERNRKEPAECRNQTAGDDKTALLTVHGLWPGLPRTIAARGVDNQRWMRFGCSTRPIPDYPQVKASRKCSAPDTGISDSLASKLGQVMPGAGGSSCLERYEFAKHGACFGFDPNAYFGTMVRLNQEVRQSPVGQFLANNYGKQVDRSALEQAIASAWGKDKVKAVKLTCHSNPAYLTEMQLTIKAPAINQPLSGDSLASQPHPGNCGSHFIIDATGY